MLPRRPVIVYMGSPLLAAELLEFIVTQRLATVRAVWTAPLRRRTLRDRRSTLAPTAVGQLARRLDIPCHEPEHIDAAACSALAHYAVDFGFIVAYGKLLPQAFFNVPHGGCFNVHFSLLPRHRGAAPLRSAILSGDAKSGISIQKIVRRLDAGPIVLQREWALGQQGYTECMQQALALTRQTLVPFFTRWQSLTALPQDETAVTHSPKYSSSATQFAVNDSAVSLQCKLRAFDDGNGIACRIEAQPYLLAKLQLLSPLPFMQWLQQQDNTEALVAQLPQTNVAAAGARILKWAYGKERKLLLWLGAAEPPLELVQLKQPGRRLMTARDFINSCRVPFPLNFTSP